MSETPKWGDFGKEHNHILNTIGLYAKDNDVGAEEMGRMFDVGITAKACLSRRDEIFMPNGEVNPRMPRGQ